jgi:hypothetical protein
MSAAVFSAPDCQTGQALLGTDCLRWVVRHQLYRQTELAVSFPYGAVIIKGSCHSSRFVLVIIAGSSLGIPITVLLERWIQSYMEVHTVFMWATEHETY